ncbi:MAG: O-antigen ligase domain-containing protein [Pedobacter sp.]|nr:MAG: O-antigen ligase domain-containing protein [Pedobacter sp.]
MKLGALAIYIVLIQIGYLFNSFALSFLPMILMGFTSMKILEKSNLSFLKLVNINKNLLLFALVGSIALIRTNYIGISFVMSAIQVINLILFIYCFTLICNVEMKRNDANSYRVIITYLLTPFLLLAVTNFVLYFLGISLTQSQLGEESGTYQAILLSYIGIDITRVEFPLAGGLNNYASYVGAVFMINIALIMMLEKKSNLLRASAVVFFITLLLIDTRSSIIYPLLILLCLYLIRNKRRLSKGLKFVSLFVVVGPLLFTVLLPLVSSLPGFEFLERGDNDLQTGNARFFIWLFAFAEFMSFKPIHIFGWGDYGHFGSGVSKNWTSMFQGWANSEYKTPHNTMLSLIFDYGYIGLILYISVIWQSIERLRYIWDKKPIVAKSLYTFVLYNIITGVTEVLGGFYFPNYILLFYMVTIIINVQYYLLKRQENVDKLVLLPNL